MESAAAVDSMEAMMASMAAIAVLVDRTEGRSGSTGSDPLRDQSDACLEGLEETARMEAMLAARKVRFTAGFADATRAMSPPDEHPQQRMAREMGVVAEVACALTVSERTASALLAESRELTTTLRLTLAALQAGNLSWQHARVMVDETSGLDPAGAAALEGHFLGPEVESLATCPAGEMVPARFRHKARTWRERHHPVSIEKRHARSVLDRRLEYAPDRDGMAWLSAYLPADQAAGIWNGITATARALQSPTEDRTLTQLRADVAAKLLLSAGFTTSTPTGGSTDASTEGEPATGIASGIRDAASPAAQVLVTVPVFALMGLTDEPADLDGYGPIPASMARKLVADGASSFRRVLTDPRNGAPLEIGRNSYPIPAAMRQWLRLRDRKCSFPGCNNQSLDNEADHILAWADGGTTGITNLESVCRKHHRLKHTTGWTPTDASTHKPPGWTSPTGRHYQSEHHDWEPPQWPPQILDELKILEELKRQDPGAAMPDSPPADDAQIRDTLVAEGHSCGKALSRICCTEI
ncbi:DUF222 domain-containing protein [Arthrobacter sp. HS15c]|uniref:HNH endonuclease signature motif containing protein n=1 Tax=Arthrobacter sp. HS15c TaxID=3230279 RepID=UPI0034664B48